MEKQIINHSLHNETMNNNQTQERGKHFADSKIRKSKYIYFYYYNIIIYLYYINKFRLVKYF